jgi:quinol monooxygenase YgiN
MIAATMMCSTAAGTLHSQPPDTTVVRIAELVIDPAQLDAYTAAVKEEMEASIRIEPGVLAIYSVAEKDKPNSLRFFEIYASEQAYRTHIESPHFKKYVAVTQPMILSRKLIETVPVQLSAKGR